MMRPNMMFPNLIRQLVKTRILLHKPSQENATPLYHAIELTYSPFC